MSTIVRPYYEHAGITIYHGDCREILPMLETPDFICTDPPYGVGFQYGEHDDSREMYEDAIPSWYSAMKNAPRMCLTPGIANICLWPQPRWVLAWLKTNSMGANRLSGPKAVSRNLWEPVLWYGTYPKNPPSRDTLKAAIGNEDSDHPCPKPLQLMNQLVLIGTSEGEVVCDPFCGSGTTLVAAKNLGRKAIGIEIEEKYCEIAAKRLSQEVLQF
jgi:DNA modification methylase